MSGNVVVTKCHNIFTTVANEKNQEKAGVKKKKHKLIDRLMRNRF